MQALKFIAESVDWYRHLPSTAQIGTSSTDLLFLEDSQPIAKDIVRLSIAFGRAMAAVDTSCGRSHTEIAPDLHTGGNELRDLVAAKSKLEASAQEAAEQE